MEHWRRWRHRDLDLLLKRRRLGERDSATKPRSTLSLGQLAVLQADGESGEISVNIMHTTPSRHSVAATQSGGNHVVVPTPSASVARQGHACQQATAGGIHGPASLHSAGYVMPSLPHNCPCCPPKHEQRSSEKAPASPAELRAAPFWTAPPEANCSWPASPAAWIAAIIRPPVPALTLVLAEPPTAIGELVAAPASAPAAPAWSSSASTTWSSEHPMSARDPNSKAEYCMLPHRSRGSKPIPISRLPPGQRGLVVLAPLSPAPATSYDVVRSGTRKSAPTASQAGPIGHSNPAAASA